MIEPKIQTRRLLKLATFLRKLPRKRFNYGVWVGGNWQGKPDLSCGTTACALGWATTIPEFRKLGLRMARHYPYQPSFRGVRSPSNASQLLFGLDSIEHSVLFLGHSGEFEVGKRRVTIYESGELQATAKQVAARIEKFVRYVKASRKLKNSEFKR